MPTNYRRFRKELIDSYIESAYITHTNKSSILYEIVKSMHYGCFEIVIKQANIMANKIKENLFIGKYDHLNNDEFIKVIDELRILATNIE